QLTGAFIAQPAEQAGQRRAPERLAALVESDQGVGVARDPEQRRPLLLGTPRRCRRAALAHLVPGRRAEAEALAEPVEAVAIAGEQLALGALLQPADGGNDEAHEQPSAGRCSRPTGDRSCRPMPEPRANAWSDRSGARPTTSSRGCRTRAPRAGSRAR